MGGAAAEEFPGPSREVLRIRPFALFWSADTIRGFASAISAVAFQVLIVSVVAATPTQISILRALGVVPYLFVGLVVGALMDRWRRQRTLVVASTGRALVLAAIPVLILTGTLDFWTLAAVILALGILTLFTDSAAQPLLPRLVPRELLVQANARRGQSETVAGTAGPALGGALLALIGAPILFAFEALITAVAAVLQSRIRISEPRAPSRSDGRHFGHDIVEGMRFTYAHRTLRPLALSIHTWFLGNSLVSTVFAVFVLRQLDVPPWAYGVALTFGGVGGFVGALIAPRLGARAGAGWGILVGRALAVVPWLMLALLPLDRSSALGVVLAVVAVAQFLWGLSMGIEDPNDTGYRQSVAPDGIQGRMNSTIRTVNRIVFFVGALLAGVLATQLGYRATIGIGAGVFAVAALIVAVSPLRTARVES